MSLSRTDLILLSVVPGTEAGRVRLASLLPPADWTRLLERCRTHRIGPLLRQSIASLDAHTPVPEQILDELAEEARLSAARHLSTSEETVRLCARLRSAGIKAFPLKGAALIAGGYYHEAGLRQTSDIDLLVDPDRIGEAHELLTGQGYRPLPGRRDLRPRQRLANEMNHLWPLRSPAGTIIELHHRAFHLSRREIDLDFRQVSAFTHTTESGAVIGLPSPQDLAFHLIHHTMIDLQSTELALRTIADLHAIRRRHPEMTSDLRNLAALFKCENIVECALELTDLLAEGTVDEIRKAENDRSLGTLLRMLVAADHSALAETSRLFEYLDLSRRPFQKVGNLAALVFTRPEHMEQLYGRPPLGLRPLQYLIRPFDLIRRFPWRGLKPSSLVNVRRLRSISAGRSRRKNTE